jgi:hypothetical protein
MRSEMGNDVRHDAPPGGPNLDLSEFAWIEIQEAIAAVV